MLRASTLLLLLSACALRQPGLEARREKQAVQHADVRCGPVGLRRAALGSRWGEYLRVTVNAPAVVTGEARLHVGSRPVPLKTFTVTGDEVVVEAEWRNERLSVPYGLEKGAVLDLTFLNLSAPNADCGHVTFKVEQGAFVPNLDERRWVAELVSRGGPDVEAWKEQQRRPPPPPPMPKLQPSATTLASWRGIPGDEREWAAWVGEERRDDPTRGWKQWPAASMAVVVAQGSSLARGAWVALMSQPPDVRAQVERHAAELGVPSLASPAAFAEWVDRLRGELETDDATALTIFAGASATRLALARAGPAAPLDALVHALPASHHGAQGPTTMALRFATAFALDWPVPLGTRVTSPFGPRNHPTLGGLRHHTGVDLSLSEGTAVVATGRGTVVRAAEDKVNGLYVVVDHGHGVTTAYLHNSKLLVVEGQQLVLGDVVSLSGNTGRSTGPHLHYQLELEGVPVDPMVFRALPGTLVSVPLATSGR